MNTTYYSWKKRNFNAPQNYFIIFNEFADSELLKDIPDNALKLYIYLGLNHFYKYDKVYYNQDLSDIINYFNKSKRTINYWIQDLVDLNLIKRNVNPQKDIPNTQLIPYELNLVQNIDYNNIKYYDWIIAARNENKLFFPIFENFKDKLYLKNLSGGALKLYIFLGIYSKYNSGESWYSIPSIAKYFNKSERTISYWIKELTQNKLIYRKQKSINTTSTTYLLTY